MLFKKNLYWWSILTVVALIILGTGILITMTETTILDNQSGYALEANSVGNASNKIAITEIEKLGAVVTAKISENDKDCIEVKLLGPGYYTREWKGGERGFRYLSGLANIGSLRIQDIEQFTDQSMIHLKGLSSLESLMLVHTQVSDDGLIYLKDLKNLKFLGLISNKFTDQALEHIKGLTNLKSLRLDDTQITNEGVNPNVA